MMTLSAPQRTVVLATKLASPRLPATLVARERLLVALHSALAHRLTLVSAAAGWGKTTLLSVWVDRVPHAVAWLSLDEVDTDPAPFWIALVTAIRTRLPDVGTLALAMLLSPDQPPLTAVLTALINDLAIVPDPAPLVVVVDDYHVITDPAIHEGMAFFVEHLPNHVHVVLATRVDPDLPLARWRARGALLEVRTAALRFTEAEARKLFVHTLDAALADDDVRRLAQRTEGWAAGLHLAALALRQRADRTAFVHTFTGSHRYVLDYVQAEILARQAPHVQRFLLQVAVLRRMNAALCTAVTNEPNSQAVLEALERNNLFVVPLDDERQWYRMHDLFREVLLARLQVIEPELIPQLHRRAAQWYAAQNEMREAITHALAAQDFAFAADLIEQVAPHLWLRGEARRLHAWITTFPDAVVQQHARLVLDAALRLLESFHAVVAETYRTIQADVELTIARVETVLDALPDAEASVLRRRIGLLQALLATRSSLTRNDAEQMRLLAERSAALAEGEEGSWKLLALGITFWYVESIQREGALLIPQLLQAKQQVIEAGTRAETVRVMRWLAFAYVRAGRLRASEAECREALTLIEHIGQQSPTTGYFYLFLNWVYYAFNQLDKAASAGQQALQIAHTWQQVDLLVAGNDCTMWVALAHGDLASAEQALLSSEALIEQERFATHTGAVRANRVSYWLARGNLAAAHTWAEQVERSPQTWHPNRKWEVLLLIRVYLAQENYTRALATLQEFSPYLDRAGDVAVTISFLALRILALQGAGEWAQAHAVLLRLLALTEDEGNLRVFLDAGEPMRKAIQHLHDQPRGGTSSLPAAHSTFVAQLLAAFEREAERAPSAERRTQQDDAPAPHAAPQRSSMLVEPLTVRERQVLRLLLAGASNAEIAAELVISVATAKKHVSSVLGKLGVATRAQAVARAREFPTLTEP